MGVGTIDHFCHYSIERYTTVFGGLFSNLTIKRSDGKEIKIPISYAAGKTYKKIAEGRDREGRRYKMILPVATYELMGIEKQPDKQTNNKARIIDAATLDNHKVHYQYNRVPYGFSYVLSLKAKNRSELYQMVEQIVPYFDQPLVVKINDIDPSEMTVEQNVKINLDSVDFNDQWEGNFEEPDLVECTMNFTLSGYLYKKTIAGPVIETVIGNIASADSSLINLFVVTADTTPPTP